MVGKGFQPVEKKWTRIFRAVGSSDIVATGFNPLKKMDEDNQSHRLDRYCKNGFQPIGKHGVSTHWKKR